VDQMKAKPKSNKQSSSDLIERFNKDCDLRELSSIKDYICRTKEFCAFLEARGKNPLNADRDDLKEFLGRLKERDLKSMTINRIFTCLSAFYEFLIVEELVEYNLILPFRKYYLRRYKNDNDSEIRKLISVEDASKLVNSVLDTRDRCILVLLFKTGMRLGELTRLDVSDINLDRGTIHLKQTAKRSNRVLYLDDGSLLH
jgi:integrase/recombinase XerD